MIAIDANLLVYATVRQSPWNARAYQLLAELAASGTQWGIPSLCLAEYYAVVTNRRLYKPCLTVETAMAVIDRWLECPTMTVLGEDASTWEIVRDLALAAKSAGPRINDARIAAICIQHDVAELWTNDRDFRKFHRLRLRNPLVDPRPSHAGERRARYRVERRGRPSALSR